MAQANSWRKWLDPEAVARLGAFPLAAKRPMVGAVSGKHASPHRGASVEFAEYRRYVPGDDLRRLDWRAYGRSDRYYVKEFEADTNLRCCLVLDTSGSMGFGSGELTKLDYARRLCGCLAQLAINQGDAIGLTCVGQGPAENLPPRRTPAQLRPLFDALDGAVAGGETRLAERLHELAETTAPRALVVLVSDLLVDVEALQPSLNHLRFRHHDVVVFQLLDPQEIEFEFKRPTRFVDLEGDGAVLADPSEIADGYRQAMRGHLEQLRRVMLESSIDFQQVRIDEDHEQVLFRFLAGRMRTRGVR